MSKHCENCANAATPLCETCSFIESVKGESTPTNYCGYDQNSTDINICDLAALIETRIKHNYPIQLRYVIRYNKLLEANKNGKKENISTS